MAFMKSLLPITLSALVVLAGFSLGPAGSYPTAGSEAQTDSVQLEAYTNAIKYSFFEDYDSLTPWEVDSLFYEENQNILAQEVHYAPDSSFKIFTIEVEGCGAYCNSTWYSWLHYNLLGTEQSMEVNLSAIEAIHVLPDNKYLVIDRSWGRPASVLTVSCLGARLLSFSGDSLNFHPIAYRNQAQLDFCQENGTELDIGPYLTYDPATATLSYGYGNNFLYSQGIDIDTIRQGHFQYIAGNFVLQQEAVIVNNRQDNQEGE